MSVPASALRNSALTAAPQSYDISVFIDVRVWVLARKDLIVKTQTDVATLVREIRERLGLTQEKFAARLGVTFPTINRWENGKAKPSPLALLRIKDLLREMGQGGDDLRLNVDKMTS